MKSFNEVARATQRKRLRDLAVMGLQRYGIADAKLRFLSDTANTVFRVDTAEQRYVLRINPYPVTVRLSMRIEAELRWLLALQHDTTLAVPLPIAAQDGALLQVVATKGIPEARCVTLLRWMSGRTVGERANAKVLAQMGAFMAQLHCHTEQFVLPDHITLPDASWNKLTYWQDRQHDTSVTLSTQQADLCAIASEQLLAEIEQIGRDRDYGLIHADLNLYNCLMHQGQLRVIDFADCRFDSHFYDIAVPLTYLEEQQNYEALCAAFYEGYNRVRRLGGHYKRAVETFMIARAFDMIEWIHFDWPSPTHFPYGPELLSSAIERIRKYMG